MADRDEHFRLEPTVFGAVRRYPAMVLAVVLLTVASAVGITMARAQEFRAQATVTVPQPLSSQGQAGDQYLASQVLLLKSPEVAERAVGIANASLGGQALAEADFKGENASLDVIPPDATSTPGTYGANIITVAFTWSDARGAQAGANAVLRAFDEVRSEAIRAQGQATVAGIERAIRDARTRGQLSDLVNQRTEVLVNEQMDLARHPTMAWAAEPRVPVSGSVVKFGVLGLLVGMILGAALAFARASRRRSFDDELQPATLYGAPLLGGLPASVPGTPSGEPGEPVPLAMTADRHSADAEAFRFAAGSVQRIRTEQGKRLSLAFVSTVADPARSEVVANLAVAIAESGTRVLAVDADASRGGLTARLLPGSPNVQGLEQVLAGTRAVHDCVERSPLQARLSVLPSGAATPQVVTGAAYLTAVRQVLGKGKAGYEVVLVDGPPLLQAAVATELVDAADAVVVVMGPHEPVRDHLEVLRRLDLVEANVVGYLYRREPAGRRLDHLRHLLPHGSARLGRAKAWLARPSRSAEVDPGPPPSGDGRSAPLPGARG